MNVRNFGLAVFLLSVALVLTGCQSTIKNQTPAQVLQNGSEVYTLEMTVSPNGEKIITDSCSARIVIDGGVHRMNKTDRGSFTHNYRRPSDKHKASYYYELDYKARTNGQVKEKSARSKLYDLTIVNRYVIGFESNRAIPGSTIILLGRGFEEGDYIEIGGVACETTFVSPNSLSFEVPMLGKHGKHHAILVSENGDIGLGDFQIDQVFLYADTEQIECAPGEKQAIIVSIDFDAPATGVLIDVTTNIPDSVIMNDILIPAGARSATAIIQGGEPGSGMLYLTAGGFEELRIPIEVVGADSMDMSLAGEESSSSDEEFLTL